MAVSWHEFTQDATTQAGQRLTNLNLAVTHTIDEFVTYAMSEVHQKLTDPVEAESGLGEHLVWEAIHLLAVLGLAKQAFEAAVATTKALVESYSQQMSANLKVSAHDGRMKAKDFLSL